MSGPNETRPPFRFAAPALIAAVLVIALLGVAAHPNLPGCPAMSSSGATSPVQHVFFVVKENHAFENYFGTYPGVVGDPPVGAFPASYGSNRTVGPFALNASSTPDLPHDRTNLLAAVDGGRNDYFVAQARWAGYAQPEDALGYYTEKEIPVYFDLARNYSLADRFFSGVLGPTLPNRFFDLAATTGGWMTDGTAPPAVASFPTILDQLSDAGVSWAYDYSGTRTYLAPLMFPSVYGDACRAERVQPLADLPAQLASPDPPAVTFIDPSTDSVYSEHPAQNVTLGSEWTATVLHEIFQSPVAASSAVFLFFDEGGGFWDPVAPPPVDAVGDGLRVPLLTISPWTPAGSVTDAPFDPAALLHFVDRNWGLPPLNDRVAQSAWPTDLFDFNRSPRAYVGPVAPLDFGTIAPSATPSLLGPGHSPIEVLPAGSVAPGASSAVSIGLHAGAADPRRSRVMRKWSPKAERGQRRPSQPSQRANVSKCRANFSA